jgi:hypothetical protein
MAAEMPAQVEPAGSAQPVEFPWGSAEEAVSALNRVAATLGDQLTIRHQMEGSLSDWKGDYRWYEFNPKYGELTRRATDLVEQLRWLASATVSAAEDANQDQRQRNSIAENSRIPPLGGRR